MRLFLFSTIVMFLTLISAQGSGFAANLTETSAPALIVMPDDGANPLERIISESGKSIDIVMHRLDDERILKAISAAAKRGIKVRAMLEKYPQGIGGENVKAQKALEAAGAFTKWGNPEFGSTFQRTLIVDSRAAYVSTFDFTQEALKGARGFVIKLVDPREVKEVAEAFEADWKRKRETPVSAKLAWAPTFARRRISDLIRGARHSLFIYSERVGDTEVERELERAIKRGIAVKIIVGDSEGANGPGVTSLKQLGARVHVMKKPKLMANAILVDAGYKDEVVLVGSLDLSTFSLDRDRGLAVLISDQSRIIRLKKIFESDFSKTSD
ncbi:MAG: phospholipase D-like domain-containing protein [Pseudomonadota bacterium]